MPVAAGDREQFASFPINTFNGSYGKVKGRVAIRLNHCYCGFLIGLESICGI